MREIREVKFSMEAVFDIADAQDWISFRFGPEECEKKYTRVRPHEHNMNKINSIVRQFERVDPRTRRKIK